MTRLDGWLKQATRWLSKDSVAQVSREIREHYESAWEAAYRMGVSADEADRLAVIDLGDAAAANRQYRKVLLTSGEAKILGDAKREAHAVCSRPWLRLSFSAMPVAALCGAVAFLGQGERMTALMLFTGALGLGIVVWAQFLPVYTKERARVFRVLKWILLTAMFTAAFCNQPWLLIACGGPVAWVEWQRAAVRKKLPVAQWPKALYL